MSGFLLSNEMRHGKHVDRGRENMLLRTHGRSQHYEYDIVEISVLGYLSMRRSLRPMWEHPAVMRLGPGWPGRIPSMRPHSIVQVIN